MDCCTAFCSDCRVTSRRTTSSDRLVSRFRAWSCVTMVMSQPFTWPTERNKPSQFPGIWRLRALGDRVTREPEGPGVHRGPSQLPPGNHQHKFPRARVSSSQPGGRGSPHPQVFQACFFLWDICYLHDLVSNLQASNFSRASLRHPCDINALERETQVRPCDGHWTGPLYTGSVQHGIAPAVPLASPSMHSSCRLCHSSQEGAELPTHTPGLLRATLLDCLSRTFQAALGGPFPTSPNTPTRSQQIISWPLLGPF